jgi:hypothetical protein
MHILEGKIPCSNIATSISIHILSPKGLEFGEENNLKSWEK